MSLGNRISRASIFFAAALSIAGCDYVNSIVHRAPNLKFEKAGTDYASKPDFAQVEYKYPLAPADLAKLTPQNIANYSQEQVDQIYARLSAGPIPDGPFDGGLFLPKNSHGDRRIAEIVGGIPGLAVELKTQKIETLGAHLWRGKVFYRDQRLLRNRIEDLQALKPIIDGDLSTIPKIDVDSEKQWLMFPRACSTRGASPSSSTMHSPTNCQAIASARITWQAATAFRSATRSAWCGPAFIWAARTPARRSC